MKPALPLCLIYLPDRKANQQKNKFLSTPPEDLLLRSLEICRKGGNIIFKLWVLPVLAELHLKKGEAEKTTEYVDRGLELMKPDQNWYGLPAPVYLAGAMLATARQDWDMAAEFFDRAMQINRQYRLPWDEAKMLYERGLMYLTRRCRGRPGWSPRRPGRGTGHLPEGRRQEGSGKGVAQEGSAEGLEYGPASAELCWYYIS